jgi:hypothetical protein
MPRSRAAWMPRSPTARGSVGDRAGPGPSGVGKTSQMAAAGSAGRRVSLLALEAGGAELEGELAFAVRRRHLGADASEELCTACPRSTQGNPLVPSCSGRWSRRQSSSPPNAVSEVTLETTGLSRSTVTSSRLLRNHPAVGALLAGLPDTRRAESRCVSGFARSAAFADRDWARWEFVVTCSEWRR